MMLSKRLPAESMLVLRPQQQQQQKLQHKTARYGLAAGCSVQQALPLQPRRLQRTIACVQPQQHDEQQQQQHPVVKVAMVAVPQQQDSTTSPPPAAAAAAAAVVAHTQAAQQSASSSKNRKLPLLVASKVHSKWQQLAGWCRQHRVQQLLWGSDGSGRCSSAVAALSMVPLLPGNGFSDLFTNRVFLAGFWAWFTAQTLKIFTKYLKKGVWDLKAIVDSGGMPSSHSALCAGITTAIAFQHGMGSSAFALAVALSSIVMYDAAGVRRHAGKQAEVLNQVIGELLEGHPVSDVKLKEVLGHTPLQVGCGAVLGVLFGIFFPVPEPSLLVSA